MRRWFEALPVHRKLTALALGVSAVALVVAVLGLTVFDVARYRRSAADEAHALAQVLAENLAAAIVFDDATAASATLSSVRVRPTVVLACVYRANGTLLAAFARAGADRCPPGAHEELTWQSVSSGAMVLQNGKAVGSVFVVRDLSDLRARVIATAGAGLFVLLIGGMIALGLARLLQGIVSRPIIALAQAARSIGRNQQYSLPPIPAPPDEIGELVKAFDDMVHRVGAANAALMETNDTLRNEVQQRRQMEVEREALLEREREASRLKDEFLAAVSHELRTPLNAIMGWTQILQSPDRSEETIGRAIASLSRNAQAQNRVIEDLLDISRIITGKLRLAIGPVDLRAVVDAAVDVVEPVATSRGITLRCDIPTMRCEVQGDYDRLRQVLWNLLSNALKFTHPGGRVDVRLGDAGDRCIITVTDTGVGIMPAFLPHVFERFRQADGSTTREHGGLGLGLAIVKELVELHGGWVRADSAGSGRGATFTVSLPHAMSARAAADQTASAVEPGPRLDGLTVMVVDDNADALEMLRVALEGAGAVVRTESSGEAAIAAWKQADADVLLCDLAMPGIDGFEVLERVRAVDAGSGKITPALAVTAYASEDYRARCLRAGFAAHLAKPLNIADVLRAVAAAAQN